MQVNSLLTGKRGVSLPFTDLCPVIAEDQAMFDGLLLRAIDYGREHGWKTLGLWWIKILREGDSQRNFLYP